MMQTKESNYVALQSLKIIDILQTDKYNHKFKIKILCFYSYEASLHIDGRNVDLLASPSRANEQMISQIAIPREQIITCVINNIPSCPNENMAKGTTDHRVECFCQSNFLKTTNKAINRLTPSCCDQTILIFPQYVSTNAIVKLLSRCQLRKPSKEW